MEEKYFIYMAKKGDYDSFKILYDKYYMKVYNYVYGKMKNKSDVEDIIQVAFLKVYKNLKFYDNKKGNFYNFILTNCKQVISDFYTKKMTRESIAEEVGFDEKVVNDVLIDNSDIGNDNYNITSAIQKLTEEQKEAFILIYIKHIKQKEAAQIMGKSVGSVKSLAFRARQVLKEEIAKNNPELGKRYGFTKYLKIAIILTVGFALIGGFTYAMFRLYKANVKKNTYFLTDIEKELPEGVTEISREDATDVINNYIDILEINYEVNSNNVHLLYDYDLQRKCWSVKNEKFKIEIDSSNNDFLVFLCYDENIIYNNTSVNEKLEKLKIIDGYTLYDKIIDNDYVTTIYAKKYGEVFNLYQKVTVIEKENKIMTVININYDYSDTKINISKDEVRKMFEEKNISIKNIEMTIEKIVRNDKEDLYTNVKEDSKLNELELLIENSRIIKVWKVESIDNRIYYVDVESGYIIELN